MPLGFRIESSRATLDSHFAYQASLHQVAQIVIDGSPRRARIEPVDCCKDFGGSGMSRLFNQKRHDSMTLWRNTQTAAR
jgi:hypothetical protein